MGFLSMQLQKPKIINNKNVFILAINLDPKIYNVINFILSQINMFHNNKLIQKER
jgi:hypothetical protein